ncbi:MAG: alpha/beta hydrolase-fold protein [Saprospiraceae bacterium]
MTFLKTNFILLLFTCLFTNISQAQKIDSTGITIAEIKIIHSTILNEDRKIYVYTPLNHSEPLPVIYLMDGEMIPLVAGIVDFLYQANQLPPMIIVGIGNYEYDRARDLTPTHSLLKMDGKTDNPGFKSSGGGENFLKFIKDELMPYVEKNYSTSPNKIFFGHSLGGLMSSYCLLNHPEMFNSYIAISPSLWWDKEFIFKSSDILFKNKDFKNKNIFFSDGNEGAEYHKSVIELQSLIQQKKITGLRYKYIPYPEETHNSEVVKATQDGLNFIFENWKPAKSDTTFDLIVKFYQKRSEQNGFQELPPEQLINEMGYNFLNAPNKLDEAIKLFELNTKNYPTSFNAFDSLGDGYAAKGDKEKAIAAYKKSIAINPNVAETQKKLKALQ